MDSETVLIVEDDPTMLRGLKDNFEFEGYSVITATDGERGLDRALNSKPALIILDIMLPKINGYEICRLIRKEGLAMPIIMLTAKGQESDIVLGLNLGADDYVTKPFSIRELMARANAFIRRGRSSRPAEYVFGDCVLDVASRTMKRGGRHVELTPKEYALLEMLASKAGKALSRDEILRCVWGYDAFVTSRSVDRCVNTLRRKIECDPAAPKHIHTVREIGYRFEM